MKRIADGLVLALILITIAAVVLLHPKAASRISRARSLQRSREAVAEAAKKERRIDTPAFVRELRVAVARRLGVQPKPPSPFDNDPRYLFNLHSIIRGRLDFTMLEATPDQTEYPEALAVLNQKEFTECSAVLLDSKRALTVEHCLGIDVKGVVADPEVTAGSTIVDAVPSSVFRVQGNKDLGLVILFLNDELKVKTRARATTADIDNAKAATAVGYGLMELNTLISPGQRASADFVVVSPSCSGKAKSGNPDASEYRCVKGAEVVATANIQNQGTCKGDSGGPLMVWLADKSLALAAVTRGPVTPGCGQTSNFVRIDAADVRKWIDDTKTPPAKSLAPAVPLRVPVALLHR